MVQRGVARTRVAILFAFGRSGVWAGFNIVALASGAVG
jgi:hypothetical protein